MPDIVDQACHQWIMPNGNRRPIIAIRTGMATSTMHPICSMQPGVSPLQDPIGWLCPVAAVGIAAMSHGIAAMVAGATKLADLASWPAVPPTMAKAINARNKVRTKRMALKLAHT